MSEMDAWQEAPSGGDLKKFADLCNNIVNTEKKIDELEKKVKKLQESIKEDEEKLLSYMTESGLKRLDGEHGHVEVDEIVSIRVPATQEEKIQFFKYLEDQGLFYGMVSVNSRTLNSWAKKEIKAMEEKTGQTGWVPPGLQAPYREFKLKAKLAKG